MFLGQYAQGFVELPACLEDVRDLALGDGAGADVAEFLEDGQLFFGSDTQGFVELSACLQDVGDLSLCDGLRAGVTELFEDG